MIVQQELLSNSYKWNSYKYNFIKIQPFSFMTGLGSWTLILGTHSSAEGLGGGGKAVLFLSCSFFFLSLFYLLILFLQLPLRPWLKTSHLLITFISREMREDTTGVQCKAWPLCLYRSSASHHVHSLRTGRRLLLASFHVMGILGSLRKAGFSSQVADRVFLIFFLAGIKLLAPLLFVSGHEPWLPDCPDSKQGSILLTEQCIYMWAQPY